MQYIPQKIFILNEGQYIEICFECYQRLIKQNPEKRFYLFGDMLMEVSEEDYHYFSKERERARYLKKLSGKYDLSYDALTTDLFNGEDIILDEKCCVEQIVEQKLLLNKLQEAIKNLSGDEIKLIKELYQDCKSEREVAMQEGVTQVAIHKRKQRIIDKLKKFFEII